MSNNNRQRIEAFVQKIDSMELEQLVQLKGSFNRAMAAGKSPFGNVNTDYEVLAELVQRIRALEAKPLTPERSFKAEVEALAKAHGVSVGVAKRFLEKRDRRDPLDTPRHRIERAPDPEPAEAQREQRHERPDLREWNRFGGGEE